MTGPAGGDDAPDATEVTASMKAQGEGGEGSGSSSNNNGVEMLYSPGDSLYVLEDGQLYKSKVEKVDPAKGYFIHFLGWHSRYDVWVEASRCLPDTPENEAEAKHLSESASVKTKKVKVESSTSRQVTALAALPDKSAKVSSIDIKRDTINERVDDSAASFLPLPLPLKRKLVHDWECITQAKQLHCLPRDDWTADEVLDAFMEEKLSSAQQRGRKKKATKASKSTKSVNQTDDDNARWQELVDGLKIYFDKALPVILLYRQERQQYIIACKRHQDLKPIEIYGAEHLLRLFVKLPRLLAETGLSSSEMSHLQSRLSDVLKFLQRNADEMFAKKMNSDSEVLKEMGGGEVSKEEGTDDMVIDEKYAKME